MSDNKLIPMWMCPHCRAQYMDEDMARRCMEGHAQPVRVAVADQGLGRRYPDSVWVKMDDGTTFRYQRV